MLETQLLVSRNISGGLLWQLTNNAIPELMVSSMEVVPLIEKQLYRLSTFRAIYCFAFEL